jgi:hypothetical protein
MSGYIPYQSSFIQETNETNEKIQKFVDTNSKNDIQLNNFKLDQKASKSCGPTCIQFLQGSDKKRTTIDPYSSPGGLIDTSELRYRQGVTNQNHLLSIINEEKKLKGEIVTLTPEWMGGVDYFKNQISAWFSSKNSWIISILHPNLEGHWIVLLGEKDDKCVFYDPYTGYEGEISWNLLYTWFKRDYKFGDNIMASAIKITKLGTRQMDETLSSLRSPPKVIRREMFPVSPHTRERPTKRPKRFRK